MNFQQLEYVLAVDRHKHFARAAESCDVTQATLSAMIKRLETEIGVVLFDRSRHPIQTTEEGLRVVELAKSILAQRQQMMGLKQEEVTALRGQLSLGIIPTIANSLLPILLPPLLEKNPELELTVHEVTTEEILQQLHTDRLDLGLLATPLNDDRIEESILYYEAMMVYGIREKGKKYVTSRDVKNNKVWLLEEGHCFREQAVTICSIRESQQGIGNLNFEGNSFETLLNLTDQFGGYTLIPELYFHDMPKKRQDLTRPFEAPIPVREVSLVAGRQYTRQRTMAYLTEFIKQLIESRLVSANYRARDLEIVGIM